MKILPHTTPSVTDPVLIAQRRHRLRALWLWILVIAIVVPFLALYILVRQEVIAIKEEKQERAALIQGLNAIADLNSNRARAEAALLALEKASPSSVDVPSRILPQLITTARTHELEATFRVTGDHEGGPPGVNFDGTVRGKLENIVNYVTDVESEDAIIEIHSLEFNSEGGGFRLSVAGTVYTRQEQ